MPLQYYKPRKDVPISITQSKPIEFIALDWYQCDLQANTIIERKNSYLNQEHSKTYTIFIFGVTSEGHSVCLRVKNYTPYFYVQIPDNFNDKQIQDFIENFNSANCEDYDHDELEIYEEAIEKRDFKFTEGFKFKSRYFKDSIVQPVMTYDNETKKTKYVVEEENKKDLKTQLVEKKIFWTFMNEQKFTFIKLANKSIQGLKFIERAFKSPLKLNIEGKLNKPIKYSLFESDLEPILRFLHDTKIKPSSWIHIDGNKYDVEIKQSRAQINISCDWTELQPLEKADIPPILIASFDIEADSSHGDFPIPKKDCKKLSNQLAITWIRDIKTIEKKTYEKYTSKYNELNLGEDYLYSDKKNIEYDNEINKKFIIKLDELITQQININDIPTKEIQYLREVIKYIKAKNNINLKQEFFEKRIKQAQGYPQYTDLDPDINLIYLKKPTKAKIYNNSPDFINLINKIYHICNRPIRKVKADNLMKKAVKEVIAIETARIAKSTAKFAIDDLVKIINEVSKKNDIQEKDLQDKIITKETMVRFINYELNKAYGFAEGDKVIQIGTVFWRYGEEQICHNNIITLKGCEEFNIGEQKCEVISRTQERDVLLEWTKLIEKHDPDIIIGYNTFGFDESFMYDRITDLCIDVERTTLTREDMKELEENTQYQKFINMGRFDESIYKKVSEAKGGIINKKLSSSALGDNFLYYFNMPGRVQIDLLKVCQSSLTKLPSYKLDSVAEYYISGKIKDVICNEDEIESCYIKVDNINELEIGNYIVISMAATTAKLYDGDKIQIIDINREAKKIKVNKPIPKSCLLSGPVWGLGKDDVGPQDIFRMQKGTNADRAMIAKYCIQDCALLIRLLRKLEVITNNFGMSNVCLVPFSYIFLRGQGIKAFSLVTNECAKENFLLPLLEKIDPEEVNVDDTTRRNHTLMAQQQEQNDGNIDTDNEDNNDDNEDDEIQDDDMESSEIKHRFKLKKNFNQIIMNDESYEGAIVLNPKTDIYTEDPITVLDFSSLYPSEMITSDLSHDRICEDPYWLGDAGAKRLKEIGLSYLDRTYDNYEWIDPKKRSKGKRKSGMTTVRFVQYPDGRKGLIPRILMGLLKSRKDTKKKMDAEPDEFKKRLYDGLQLAYKITANSVYGQIGARTSTLYKPQIAASTTAGGRGRITHARDFVLRNYPNSEIVYGDTDSIFVKFNIKHPEDGDNILSDRDKIDRAIKLGQDVEKNIKKELPGVHSLAYEKVLFPFILISKKRYLALKYEDSPDTYKQISMGLVLKRRDNAPILKHCYLGVIDCLIKDKNITKAIEYVQNEIKKMIDGKFDMNMYVISKTLSSYYKDPESIAHAVLAQRMAERDPGNKPASNDRIPYVFIKIKEEPGIDYLQGDRIEHVNYVRQNSLKVDYEKYITNQIMKPISQLFELIVERLPGFPYGIGYYNEVENIYYNKYEGDEKKLNKKLRDLKSRMVQKLIFQSLINYANTKANNIITLEKWIKPIENGFNAVNKNIPKPAHDIKVKKNKQISLDKYF